jgi:hypothetical protein
MEALQDVRAPPRRCGRGARANQTGEAKKGSSVRWLSTYAHSTTSGSPSSARRHEAANSAAAYAIDSVAEPLPACAVAGEPKRGCWHAC